MSFHAAFRGAFQPAFRQAFATGYGPRPASFRANDSNVDTTGLILTVTFSGAVSGSDTLGFTFLQNGIPMTVTGPGAIVGLTTWQYTITSGVVDIGDIVRVQYDDVAGTLVTDENALDVASFGPTTVINNSTQGTASPLPLSAVVDAAGTTFTVVFDQGMTGDPDLGFTMSRLHGLSLGLVVGDTVTWTITPGVVDSEVVTLAYDSGVGDMAGTSSDLASFASLPITNNSTVPGLNILGGSVDATGLILTTTYDEDVAGDPNVGFTCTHAISNGVLSGADIIWDIAQVYAGEVVTLSYTPGDIEGTPSGDPLGDFPPLAVTNNSTVSSSDNWVVGGDNLVWDTGDNAVFDSLI